MNGEVGTTLREHRVVGVDAKILGVMEYRHCHDMFIDEFFGFCLHCELGHSSDSYRHAEGILSVRVDRTTTRGLDLTSEEWKKHPWGSLEERGIYSRVCHHPFYLRELLCGERRSIKSDAIVRFRPVAHDIDCRSPYLVAGLDKTFLFDIAAHLQDSW